MFLKRYLLVISLCLLSCKQQKETKNELVNNINSLHTSLKKDYDFENPKLFKLNNALEEISGLGFYDGFIFTHNDEQGIIFKIDAKTGNVIDEIPFGKDADYEGIEVADQEAIIIKSNGNLSFFDFNSEKLSIEKNQLKTHNDVEGLCFNNNNELLIACKGQMLNDDLKNKAKAIYSYNIKRKELDEKPFLIIKDKTLEKYLKNKFKDIDVSKKKKKRMKQRAVAFAPSGIAIHPKTKKMYLTSAKGNLLVIYNSEKELEDIIFLNNKQLPQPEGICFDNDANLYISTETKGSVGRIYKYTYQ